MKLTELDERFLLTPKLIYFAAGSVVYALTTFRIRFIKEFFDFDTAQAGSIASVLSLAAFLFMTAWSSLSDSLGKHRLILCILALFTSLSFVLLWFEGVNTRFWIVNIVFAFFGAFQGGILPLTDFQILKLLTEKFKVNRSLYGRQRMMGTVSYGVTSLLIGVLFDFFKDVRVIFILFPIFSAIFISLLIGFGFPDAVRTAEDSIELAKSSKTDQEPKEKPRITVFFTDFSFVFFLLTVFITGCGRQVLQVYLPLFLQNEMKLAGSQAGMAVVSSTVFSVVFLFIGAEIIAFFGVYMMLIIGMATMGVRLMCYQYIPLDPSYAWLVYCIELLNGVAFSFTHLAGVKIAADFSPRGLEATSQAVYTSFYMQLPPVIVSYVGGKMYSRLLGAAFFGWTGKATLACSVLVALKFIITGKVRPSQKPQIVKA